MADRLFAILTALDRQPRRLADPDVTGGSRFVELSIEEGQLRLFDADSGESLAWPTEPPNLVTFSIRKQDAAAHPATVENIRECGAQVLIT